MWRSGPTRDRRGRDRNVDREIDEGFERFPENAESRRTECKKFDDALAVSLRNVRDECECRSETIDESLLAAIGKHTLATFVVRVHLEMQAQLDGGLESHVPSRAKSTALRKFLDLPEVTRGDDGAKKIRDLIFHAQQSPMGIYQGQ
ncbi:hypothetical protein Sjap_001652 [Stephania japonica]|uniref:Uncharacterized protein n=1 Tax=Stephania japonica TaxID=461633 RepID=A0AAP0KMN4_9MAGN